MANNYANSYASPPASQNRGLQRSDLSPDMLGSTSTTPSSTHVYNPSQRTGRRGKLQCKKCREAKKGYNCIPSQSNPMTLCEPCSRRGIPTTDCGPRTGPPNNRMQMDSTNNRHEFANGWVGTSSSAPQISFLMSEVKNMKESIVDLTSAINVLTGAARHPDGYNTTDSQGQFIMMADTTTRPTFSEQSDGALSLGSPQLAFRDSRNSHMASTSGTTGAADSQMIATPVTDELVAVLSAENPSADRATIVAIANKAIDWYTENQRVRNRPSRMVPRRGISSDLMSSEGDVRNQRSPHPFPSLGVHNAMQSDDISGPRSEESFDRLMWDEFGMGE